MRVDTDSEAPATVGVHCARMTAATLGDARTLLETFLTDDAHYRASSAAYGDGGRPALERALQMFLARPELGFVWLAYVTDDPTAGAVGACVACYAISTSRGTLVAKLDDVNVHPRALGRGIGTAMLRALNVELIGEGVTRVDSACHRENGGAWRFYARLGFVSLDEERIALLLS